MRDFLLIYVNGKRHEVRGQRVFQSLSDFLRYDLRLTGTKIVCAEGDCGSCSVFLGAAANDRIQYRTVTSCIQFLYQLDCTHVVTIEGLAHDGALNPIQESMVKCHGAQCGFCTPGFVISLQSLGETGRPAASAADADVRAACVGNLCRCTGYEPIIRAAMETDFAGVRSLNDLYPPAGMLADLQQHQDEEVAIECGERRWFKPTSVESAVRFKAQQGGCTIFSGGTDLGVQINKGLRDPKVVMSLSGLTDFHGIRAQGDVLSIGSADSIADMERACAKALPEYAKLLYYFGSPPIKNAGTLGGNIANGSPIGDTMPALFVLNAEIELVGANGARRVNMNEFYTGYRKTVMRPDELIARVFIPLPRENEVFKLYKISRRKDLDISAFAAAIWMRLQNGVVADVRIAYGGVGPVILRLPLTEQFLIGQPLSLETLAKAGAMARGEITPISDVRGSAGYRAQLGENILKKFFFEMNGGSDGEGNGMHDGNGDGRAAPAPGHPRSSVRTV